MQALVADLYHAGMNFQQIARRIGKRTTYVAKVADELGLPRRRRKVTDWVPRFLAKVATAGPNECWLWTASTNQDDYGRFHVGDVIKQAHHVAYFIHHGRWPDYVMHSCDTPRCCNPAHLVEGTHHENILDCWVKGRGRRFKFTHLAPQIRELIAVGKRNRDICAALGVPNDCVSRVRHGVIYAP